MAGNEGGTKSKMKAKRKSTGDGSSLKVSVSTKRHVYTYAELWHTSKALLERGQEQEAASAHQFRASLAFTAFTLEAYSDVLPLAERILCASPAHHVYAAA